MLKKFLITTILFIAWILWVYFRLGSLWNTVTADEQEWLARWIIFAQWVGNWDLANTVNIIKNNNFTFTTHGFFTRAIVWFSLLLVYKEEVMSVNPNDLQPVKFLYVWQFLTALSILFMIFLSAFLVYKLFGSKQTALIYFFLVLLDSFFINFSRYIIQDWILAITMVNFMLLCFMGLRKKNVWVWITAWIFMWISILQKWTAIFLFPYLGLLFLISLLLKKHKIKDFMAYSLYIFLWVVISFVVFYPAIIFRTQELLLLYVQNIFFHLNEVSRVTYFLWEVTTNPSLKIYFLFYPVVLIIKSNFILWFVLPIFLYSWFFLKRNLWKEYKFELLWLVSFIIFFTIFVSIPTLKYDRYILPAYLTFALFGAITYSNFLKFIWHKYLLFIWLIYLLWANSYYYPVFSAYRNELFNKTALNYLDFGWGDWLEHVAKYLDNNINRPTSVYSQFTRQLHIFTQINENIRIYWDLSKFDCTDLTWSYIVFYVMDIQKRMNQDIYDWLYNNWYEPEVKINLKWITYSEVFKLKNDNIKWFLWNRCQYATMK